MATLNIYTGSLLRIGSFLEMMQEHVRLINELTAAALKLDDEAPRFIAKVNQLEALVKRIRAFEETTAVAGADETRDAIWRAVYYQHHYLKGLSETHPLYVYVNRLTPVFNSYKNLHNSELMEQTAQVRGFLTEMAKPGFSDAAQQLGFSVLIPYLQSANEAVTQANYERTTSAANRQAELGEETTDEVRKQLVNLFRGIVDRVNAANLFFPSDAITSFIQRANAIADHYRVIASQTVSTLSGSGSSSGSGTTPSGNGQQTGDNTGNNGNNGQQTGDNTGNNGQQTGDNTGNNGNDNPGGNNDNPGGDNGNDNPGGDINDGGLDD